LHVKGYSVAGVCINDANAQLMIVCLTPATSFAYSREPRARLKLQKYLYLHLYVYLHLKPCTASVSALEPRACGIRLLWQSATLHAKCVATRQSL